MFYLDDLMCCQPIHNGTADHGFHKRRLHKICYPAKPWRMQCGLRYGCASRRISMHICYHRQDVRQIRQANSDGVREASVSAYRICHLSFAANGPFVTQSVFCIVIVLGVLRFAPPSRAVSIYILGMVIGVSRMFMVRESTSQTRRT